MPVKKDLRDIALSYERLQTVKKLRQLIRRIWNLQVDFVLSDGQFLDSERGKICRNHNLFCHKCMLDPEGVQACDESIRGAVAIAKRSKGELASQTFLCHAGFEYLGVPVFLDDVFIGMVIAGGFVREKPLPGVQAQILAKTDAYQGLAISKTDEAFESIPVLNQDQIDSLTQLIEFGIEEVKMVHFSEMERRKSMRLKIVEGGENSNNPFSIVGQSQAMERVFNLLMKLRESESTVLIQGENGTGKEMVARAIHNHSPRSDQIFVTQNCSAFNDNLLDSELFGHLRGSFTGAVRDKKGLFEMANGGTFFMDEIGDMSSTLQVKLLRVLQEGTFLPVGGTEPRKVDVRIITATNKDLKKMVEEGSFREDLFYRLNVINIQVPPLRERRDDIPLLVEHFLNKFSTTEENWKTVSPHALDLLVAYNWPGNVRQLENEIQRAIVLSGKSRVIEGDVLSPAVHASMQSTFQIRLKGKLKDAMEHVERQILLDGLRRHKWNKSRLSRELGVSRATLIWKIQKYGLEMESRS